MDKDGVNTLLAKAGVLSEALPYLRRYAGKTFVIKYGGHAMGDDALARSFGRDIALLKQVGINPVVVHGGGPQIGAMLERLSISSTFVDGLRVTDRGMVDVVEMVLSGSINKHLVSVINAEGGVAVGISGKDGNMIRARKLRHVKVESDSNIERILDLGFVGEPTSVNPYVVELMQRSDIIPVIAPIGIDSNGDTYNINADTVAGAVASALGATRLLMLTDVAGVKGADGEVIADISANEAEKLIADGTISGGMIPKIETCLKAVRNDVAAAVISDGRTQHAVLLELFTESGVGTAIWQEERDW